MGRGKKARAKGAPSSQILALAISSLAIAIVTSVIAAPMTASRNPILQNFGKTVKLPAPYALAIGLLLLALYFIVKVKSPAVKLPTVEPGVNQPVKDFIRDFESPQRQVDAQRLTRREHETHWSEAVFDQIEWRRFEAVCETLFSQAGFETRTQSHGADGGVDIWLHSRHAQGPAAVVQCKHWRGKPVGVKEMREFFGVMASHKLQRGTYATSSTYTEDAMRFAKENGISPLDARALLALISTRSPEQQQRLLTVAYEGEYWRPTCASCGIKMLERTKGKTGERFWGCAHYARCRSTLPMRTR